MARKPDTISFWRGSLPHWEVVGGRYFVTINLAGAIPAQGRQRIQSIAAELHGARLPEDAARLRLQRRIFAEMERWLDESAYVQHLLRPEIAQVVMEAIRFREGREWRMFEYVIMPNHVHLFFEIVAPTDCFSGGPRLKSVLEKFKRWTGHEAGKLMKLPHDRFWQDEWFDHWSRSDEEDEKICTYIRRNPEKAKLVKAYRDWPYGSWASTS